MSPTQSPPATLYDRVHAAADAIRRRWPTRPRFGIVLGTGLGGLTREAEIDVRLPFHEVPGFPRLEAVSHEGAISLGRLAGQSVVLLEGRYHLYEGYSLEEVTFGVRVLKALGAELAVFSNAAGGLNPDFGLGDLMVIDDHINLLGMNPLIGPNDERLGPRFPDMCAPYDAKAIALAVSLCRDEGIRARRGTYAALTGPCLETRAEYRYLRIIGADAVGMSTVPEVIVAVHAGLRVFGVSCITDRCIPEELKPVNIEEILKVAAEAEPKMTRLVRRLLSQL